MENSLAAPVLISKYYTSANIIGVKVMKKKKKVGKMQKNMLKKLIDWISMYFLHLKEC